MTDTTPRKQRGRPFPPGTSGNPAGRPRGSKHKASIVAQALLDDQCEALVQKAVQMALNGDRVALRLVLERLLAPTRDRPIAFALPNLGSSADAVQAIAKILAAVAAGELEPSAGQALAALVETHRKALEVEEIEKRLTALEEKV